jgi:hypothetical protein
MPAYHHLPAYDNCYPKYKPTIYGSKQPTIADGASIYYDDYYRQVDALMAKYPRRVRMYDSYEFLNKRELMQDLFDFLNIPEPRDYEIVIGGHPTDLHAARRASERASERTG